MTVGQGRSPWRTFALVAGAVVSASMNYSVTFVSFGEIQATFASGPAATSWVLKIGRAHV